MKIMIIRLLPNLDEKLLAEKLRKQAQTKEFLNKINSLYLEWVKIPKFANPNNTKDPITDIEII